MSPALRVHGLFPAWLFTLSFALTACGGPEDVAPLGRSFVTHMAEGRYEQALALASPYMTGVMGPAELEEFWGEVILRHGLVLQVGGAREEAEFRATRVIVEVELQRDWVEVAVDVDSSRKVASVYYRRTQRKKELPQVPPPQGVVELEMTVGAEGWELPGTLALPSGEAGQGPWPTMLLVHGAGPHDRNETIGPNAPFRDLAWGLAQRGVATLRYEKRTRHHAERFVDGAGQPAIPVTIDAEIIDDAVAGLRALQSRGEVDSSRLMLVGHGLGGTFGPRVAQQARAQGIELKGLVLLAAPARPLEEVVYDQTVFLAERRAAKSAVQGKEITKELTALSKKMALVQSGKVEADTPASKLPLGLPGSYWVSIRGYDPLAALQQAPIPSLFIRGSRDFQTTSKDVALWKRDPNVRVVEIEGINHLMLPGQGELGYAEYREPAQVPGAVLDAIVGFAGLRGS